jgi:hypothetical protein
LENLLRTIVHIKRQNHVQKYFCIPCEIGHLCKKLHFDHGCTHAGHKNLQVQKVSHRNAIIVNHIKKYWNLLDDIQTSHCNWEDCFFLQSKTLMNLRRENEAY